jgi:hypothetical protein
LFVVHCSDRSYVHLGVREIGFVLHEKGGFVEDSRQKSNLSDVRLRGLELRFKI